MRYEKLRQFIKEQRMTYKEFAEVVLHTSNVNIDYKFRGRHKFTTAQIELTRKYFNLSNKQVVEFFICD